MAATYLQLVSTINSLLPATAIIAVVLFIFREVLTDYRNIRTKRKTRRAVYLLISEEIEKNYWSFKKFFEALRLVKGASSSPDVYSKCKYITKRNGTSHIRREYLNGSLNAQFTIPPFISIRYEKLIDKIAELDEEVFKSMQHMYSEIAELNHYRDTLIDYLNGEEDKGMEELTEEFLSDNLLEDEVDYFNTLNEVYKKLGNKELTRAKLR